MSAKHFDRTDLEVALKEVALAKVALRNALAWRDDCITLLTRSLEHLSAYCDECDGGPGPSEIAAKNLWVDIYSAIQQGQL